MRNSCVLTSLCVWLFLITQIHGQETTDSLKQFSELEEIVVEAQRQRLTQDGSSYIPTLTQKEASGNAFELLRHMSLPMLKIQGLNDVTAIDNTPVSVFINGIPAGKEDLNVLRPTEIIRVDYLNHPKDAKYQGAPYVVNFILKPQDWGGYTKLSAETRQFSRELYNFGFYSKFAYKRAVYDVFGSYGDDNNKHTGTGGTEYFSLLNNSNGKKYTAQKTVDLKNVRQKYRYSTATIRSSFQSSNLQLVNKLRWFFSNEPEHFEAGEMRYIGSANSNCAFRKDNRTIERSLLWNGFYAFQANETLNFALESSLNYSHNNNNYKYDTSGLQEKSLIQRRSKEDAFNINVNLSGSKQLSEVSTVSLFTNSRYNRTNIDYIETFNSEVKYEDIYLLGTAQYSAALPFGLSIKTNAGTEWKHSVTNGKTLCALSPYGFLNMIYMPTEKIQLYAESELKQLSVGEAMRTPEILRNDELLYLTGNSDLKNFMFWRNSASALWIPSQSLQLLLGARSRYGVHYNAPLEVYSNYNSGRSVLRSYVNDGQYRSLDVFTSITYRPLQQLQLHGYFSWNSRERTCSYMAKRKFFVVQADATYYIKRAYLMVEVNSPWKDLTMQENAEINYPWLYSLTFGRNYNNWNLMLRVDNPFSSS